MRHWVGFRARVLAPLCLLFATGCGSGRYPVSGRVAFDDGTPVTEGSVIGEATVDGKPVAVQGNIGKDGGFEWGADRPGDGAFPGKYKVIVVPRALSDAELAEGKRPAVEGKYANYETSGLTFEVKPEKNEFNITLPRPKLKSGEK